MRMVLSPSGDWSRQATASQQTRSVIPRFIACCLLPQTFALFRLSWQTVSRAQCKSVSALLTLSQAAPVGLLASITVAA